MIYLGGLQGVDSAIWDAAKVDGVGPFARALKIELPLIKPQISLNLVMTLSGAVTSFQTQQLMTDGGPGFSTLVPGLYMYHRAFGGSTEFGYASAVGLILFVIALLISIFTMKITRSER